MASEQTSPFDYSFVEATARIAVYDDMKSAPRVTDVAPAPTNEFIEKLTTTIYEQAKLMGGKVPYTLIREVSENFIHAQFREIVVSILDDGNTIRFADQGPGIAEKEKAQQPGFSSAVEPMKQYIRGVGSGFPIVKDYLDDRDGSICIEDNLVSGAVVTISLVQRKEDAATAASAPVAAPLPSRMPIPIPPLTDRERQFVRILAHEGTLGVTDIKDMTGISGTTVFNTLVKLEEAGIVEKVAGKKRNLTAFGYELAAQM